MLEGHQDTDVRQTNDKMIAERKGRTHRRNNNGTQRGKILGRARGWGRSAVDRRRIEQ